MSIDFHIIVCLKQVPDPEAPVSAYQVDAVAKRVVPIGVPPVISPFDENALEVALRLREHHGGKVTALSVGNGLSKSALRKALFVGTDELVLADDAAFAHEKIDGYGTARVLSEAIRKIGAWTLILTGRQAADTNAGVVGLHLAAILGIPAVTFARKIVLEGGNAVIERALPDCSEVVKMDLPALATVGAEAGELRGLRMKQMREAKSRPVFKWTAGDLGIERIPERKLILRELSEPARERDCRFIEGDTPAEAGQKLAQRLRENGII